MKERGRVTGATTTEASNGGNNSRNSQEYDASYMQKKSRRKIGILNSPRMNLAYY
jgi:hypothetical protein